MTAAYWPEHPAAIGSVFTVPIDDAQQALAPDSSQALGRA